MVVSAGDNKPTPIILTNEMELNVELRHPNAVMPSKANKFDAGFDLTAVERKLTVQFVEYDIGLAVEIPEGFVGLVYPRSSVSNYDVALCNSVGVIDSGYVGNLKLRFKITRDFGAKIYEIGERVGQLVIMPLPSVRLTQVDKITGGRDGFGSSGK